MNLDFHFIVTTLFVICFVFSLLINYILLRFAQTLGIRDAPPSSLRLEASAFTLFSYSPSSLPFSYPNAIQRSTSRSSAS
jgi:hypothetical protein